MRLGAGTLAVTAAIALSACAASSTSDAGPEEKVHEAVETLLDACAHENGLAAMEILTEPARRSFLAADSPLAGCRKVTEPLVSEAVPDLLIPDRFAAAEITEVTVHGDEASAMVESEGSRTELDAEDAGGVWQVANAR